MRPLTLLRIEPDAQLVFACGEAEEKVSRTLRIENTSEDKTAAWKVRTTAPEAFLVAPRAGTLAPGEVAEALVTLLPGSALAAGAGGLRRGSEDARFEVRAAPIVSGQTTVERADWCSFPRDTQETTQLRAVLRSTNGSANGRLHDSSREVLEAQPEHSHSWRPERPRRANLEADLYDGREPVAAARSSRELSTGRSPAISEASLRRPVAQKSAPAVLTANAKRMEEEEKPPPMGPITKAVLGVLIVILVFNLYLRPLLDMALGAASESSA